MRAFAMLYEELDTTTSTTLKVDAMVRYFRTAPPADAAWAVYILSGRRLKRFIGPSVLWRWLIDAAPLPEWLIAESYSSVGDLAEAIALLTDTGEARAAVEDIPLADWIENRLLTLRGLDEPAQRAAIVHWWRTLPYRECFLLNKLLTGELRVGVSQLLVTRALAQLAEVSRSEIAQRLMGDWWPGAEFWERLRSGETRGADPSTPYPFYLASPIEGVVADALGARDAWLAEWKWDGIRGQVIRRAGQVFIWSRGEDLVTERFPEIVSAARALPDGTVLDGELVAWRDGNVQPFADLQQRIGRKKLTPAILENVPVRFLAYDLLEERGEDLRALPLSERRKRLEVLLATAPPAFGVSPIVDASDWEALATLRNESRGRRVEGLMLKALDSPYGTGRQRGSWWKWKIDPHSFDGVMIYAQPGHGRRSNLYTDYTFGVWHDGELVPVAKAYSGLSNEEIATLDRWIRSHTLEKFGPVRAVQPTQVFELAYENIAKSSRHKSGIALRFPRILRWRTDKPASEADSLIDLQRVLEKSQTVSDRLRPSKTRTPDGREAAGRSDVSRPSSAVPRTPHKP